MDFSCSGEEPAPEESKNADANVPGKEEPREEGARRQKMELFVRESFEAKEELLVEVGGESEGPAPGGLRLEEALRPAAHEGREPLLSGWHAHSPARSPLPGALAWQLPPAWEQSGRRGTAASAAPNGRRAPLKRSWWSGAGHRQLCLPDMHGAR